MRHDEKFTLHPKIAELYETVQTVLGEEGWRGLPMTLGAIGPIRRLDLARCEGERRTGAIRVYADLPADEKGPRLLETRFHPLDGSVGWWFHHRGSASGNPRQRATELAWPSYLPMQLALYRVAELLDENPVEHGAFASWEIRRFLAGHPEGVGYANLTLTAAKSLVKYRRASVAAATPLEMEEGAWYAVSRQRPYHETPQETLEFFVGRAMHVGGGRWYLREDDDLHAEIAQRGRAAATMEWSWNVVSVDVDRQAGYAKDGLAKFLEEGRGSWTFKLDRRFAENLKTFATAKFAEESSAVTRTLLAP